MALPSRLPVGRPAPSPRKGSRRHLNVESLEPRLLLVANLDPNAGLMTHGGACSCPICSGVGLSQFQPEPAAVVSGSSGSAVAAAPTGIPQLSSKPGAAATIFLDFDGNTEVVWGNYYNVVTKVYDTDGNLTSFSASEIASIREIWARVAEDYAPFNVNVTTFQPASFANKVATRVAIGGSYSDWFGQSAGGVAYIGGFYNSASNVAYVFEDNLGNGNPRYVAEAASHEAGHTFGLYHQAVWSGNTKTDEYNPGTADWAPIMGVGYYSTRTTWHNGPTSNSPTQFQDDMAVIAGANNGFGFRADDYGSTVATASDLTNTDGNVNIAGLIGTNSDVDTFEFSTSGGALNLSLRVAQFGANLNSVLDLLNSAGQSILSSNPATSFGASLATTLAAGTYYVAVHSSGGYGNVGTYTLTGTIPGGSGEQQLQAPEISVAIGGTAVADGGTVSFGSTSVGAPVNRTITITNTGGGTLNLTALSTSMPAGFSLVSNITSTALGAGQSTSFTVRLTAAAAGTFGGTISLTNSDSDESPYDLTLSGAVSSAPAQPVIRYLDNGATGFTATGTWIRQTGVGRESDVHWAINGTGSHVATWSFTGLTAGQYRVSATFPGSTNYASDAPFSVYNGTQLLGTSRVSQKVASSGFSDGGSQWKDLGNFTITGTTLVVKLANNANGWVAADAIRIERLPAGGALSRAGLASDSAGLQALAAFASPENAGPASLQEATDLVFQTQGSGSWLHRPEVLDVLPNSGSAASSTSKANLKPELSVLENATDLLNDLAAHLGRDWHAGCFLPFLRLVCWLPGSEMAWAVRAAGRRARPSAKTLPRWMWSSSPASSRPRCVRKKRATRFSRRCSRSPRSCRAGS